MINNAIPLRIAGVGYSVPKTVITNEDLTKLYETSDEWIYTRTGIKERRLVSGNENAIDLGVDAAKKAIEKVPSATSKSFAAGQKCQIAPARAKYAPKRNAIAKRKHKNTTNNGTDIVLESAPEAESGTKEAKAPHQAKPRPFARRFARPARESERLPAVHKRKKAASAARRW